MISTEPVSASLRQLVQALAAWMREAPICGMRIVGEVGEPLFGAKQTPFAFRGTRRALTGLLRRDLKALFQKPIPQLGII